MTISVSGRSILLSSYSSVPNTILFVFLLKYITWEGNVHITKRTKYLHNILEYSFDIKLGAQILSQ